MISSISRTKSHCVEERRGGCRRRSDYQRGSDWKPEFGRREEIEVRRHDKAPLYPGTRMTEERKWVGGEGEGLPRLEVSCILS